MLGLGVLLLYVWLLGLVFGLEFRWLGGIFGGRLLTRLNSPRGIFLAGDC